MIAALAVAVLCAPGTWLRTPVPNTMPKIVKLEQVADAGETGVPGWRVAGVWNYDAQSRYFGGFSGLLALSNNTLRAFSDRGTRFTFIEPDRPGAATDETSVAYQVVEQRLADELWDIEAATRDPAAGTYWLAYESHHAIHRFTVASKGNGVRELVDEVDWPVNSGAEGLSRLADGRFVLMVEGQQEALLYPSDPVEGGEPAILRWRNPDPDFVVTDIAQLPDGRVLLLMRNLAWGLPPFESLIAIANKPELGSGAPWKPQIALRLEGIVPRENYEGLALRERSDGQVDVWVIADDNFSVMQRNLLVKLILNPSEL